MKQDERPWQLKSDFCRTIGRTPRTVDTWVQRGVVERRQDGNRAYFRMHSSPQLTAALGSPAAESSPAAVSSGEQRLLVVLTEMQAAHADLAAEIAALRAEVRCLRSTPQPGSGELPTAAPARTNWLRRLLRLEGR
jgi:hypothetical protein